LTDADSDNFRELYTLANPLGASPSLVFQGDFLEENTPSLSFIGDTMYGFQKTPGAPLAETKLVEIDPVGQTQAIVGATGTTGAGANGSAYDPDTGELFCISTGGAEAGKLYDVDHMLAGGADPTATLVGSLGLMFSNGGAEMYDGTFYALLQDYPHSLVLGTVDSGSGLFTQTLVVDAYEAGPVALAVIPEPGTLGLLALTGLAVLRRRR